MRKLLILVVVSAILLALGFGIFWKENDMIWWFYCPWDVVYTALWVDVQFDFFGLPVVWQINLYNSWMLFMNLQMACFIGTIIIILTGFLWYYTHPEPIYMAHPTAAHKCHVSYDRGKTWTLETFGDV